MGGWGAATWSARDLGPPQAEKFLDFGCVACDFSIENIQILGAKIVGNPRNNDTRAKFFPPAAGFFFNIFYH